jgi:hypothetical protein
MISKELLGVVLSNYGISGVYPSYDESDVMTAVQYEIEEIVFEINIYRLAHLCKEWARSEGLEMFIYEIKDSQKNYEVRVLRKEERDSDEYVFSWWNLDTEPEAVIKACLWILDNKDT